jgi:hypothetical protein
MKLVEELDAENEVRRSRGEKPIKDAELARQLVGKNDKHFSERVQLVKKNLSAARKILGRQIKPKREPRGGDL